VAVGRREGGTPSEGGAGAAARCLPPRPTRALPDRAGGGLGLELPVAPTPRPGVMPADVRRSIPQRVQNGLCLSRSRRLACPAWDENYLGLTGPAESPTSLVPRAFDLENLEGAAPTTPAHCQRSNLGLALLARGSRCSMTSHLAKMPGLCLSDAPPQEKRPVLDAPHWSNPARKTAHMGGGFDQPGE
jgi:hypothetical protein